MEIDTCVWRGASFREIQGIASISPLTWLILGDFDEVLSHDEYEGIGSRSQLQLDCFREATDVCALRDLRFRVDSRLVKGRWLGGLIPEFAWTVLLQHQTGASYSRMHMSHMKCQPALTTLLFYCALMKLM